MKKSPGVVFLVLAVACGNPNDPHPFERGPLTPSDKPEDWDPPEAGAGMGSSSGSSTAVGGSPVSGGSPGVGDGGAGGEAEGGKNSCEVAACECGPGFHEEEGACHDFDECALGVSACDESASCANAEGSYSCTCSGDKVGDGRFCLLSDPCEVTECGAGACQIIPSGGICDCPLGTAGTSCELSCRDKKLSDPVLGSWIEQDLGDFSGDWAAASPGVSSLSARRFIAAEPETAPVVELNGIECWTSLELLELSAQSITDFAPLAGLPRLRSLDLSCNPGSDLTHLSNLYQLRELYLDNSECPDAFKQALDLAPLARLFQLGELVLGGQTIVDWGALSHLKGLNRLHSASVNGQDLKGENLPASLHSLSLPQSGLEELPDLSHLKGITQLNFVDNSIHNAKALLTYDYAVGAEVRLQNNPISCGELMTIERELEKRYVEVYSDCLAN